MAVTKRSSIYQELAELLVSKPTREKLINFRPSRSLQQRARKLLLKRKEGRPLTNAEQNEFEQFMQAEMFVGLLKARLRLQGSKTP